MLNCSGIRTWVVLVSILAAAWSGQAVAQCRWDGTGPICDGECGAGESEQTRARTDPLAFDPTGSRIHFGSACATGTKALCCKTPGLTCRWDGTAPFCEGRCRGDEISSEPPAGSSSGAGCVTGSKAYCCSRQNAGTSRATLGINQVALIYGVTPDNKLMWYRHDGRNDGTVNWASNHGREVGVGWEFKHVFSGGDGIIYAINQKNELLWYRHQGRNDGTFKWESNTGRVVGIGWDVKHVFSGGNGVIYAVMPNNDLMWFRHEGRNDGTFRWTSNQGRRVGSVWDFKHVFSSGDGIIYAINQNNELLWYRHEGHNDGSFRWTFNKGRVVGTVWDFKHVFSGATLAP